MIRIGTTHFARSWRGHRHWMGKFGSNLYPSPNVFQDGFGHPMRHHMIIHTLLTIYTSCSGSCSPLISKNTSPNSVLVLWHFGCFVPLRSTQLPIPPLHHTAPLQPTQPTCPRLTPLSWIARMGLGHMSTKGCGGQAHPQPFRSRCC